MAHHPVSRSVNIIRRRLYLLLLRAFSIVVLITLMLSLVGAVLVSNPDVARYKIIFSKPLLQSYYLEHGSWEGVQAESEQLSHFPLPRSARRWWDGVFLVDADGQVLIDQGQTTGGLTGAIYPLAENDQRVPIRVNGVVVGALILRQENAVSFVRFFMEILFPLTGISLFGGSLVMLIGVFLVRRVVYPLADVVAAAQAVARGDLSARVTLRGPSDLRMLSDHFNHMAEALEQNEQERRNLLADVAHELRTPLTVMRGKLEGILDGIYPDAEAHVASVLEETYLLERLVDDLRLLTLAEARQLHFDPKPVDLSQVARQCVDVFEAQAAEQHITLSIQSADGLPQVMVDPQRIEQVISNLLHNALRYVPDGGQVTLRVLARSALQEEDSSTLPSAGEVDGLLLVVDDNGPGVAENELPLLFDRFWRSEKSRSRASGGTGLGLTIARQLIEAQGGAMLAQNLPGGGLRVGFFLPYLG